MLETRQSEAARWGLRAAVGMVAGFVVGLAAVSLWLPDPAAEGPTPPATRVAYYVLFAALVVSLAVIPLGVGLAERRGGRTAVAWRLVLAIGVVLAVMAVGWGVRTWAFAPHDLHRLNEGIGAALVVLAATAIAVVRTYPAPRRVT